MALLLRVVACLVLFASPSAALHSLSVTSSGSLESVMQPMIRRRRTAMRQSLANFHDVHYSANIRVGNQDLLAMVDTGAYELMVFDADIQCVGCFGEPVFDQHSSETLQIGQWTAEHDFLGGRTLSSLARDNVVAVEHSLEAEHQYFWLVSHAAMPALDLDGFHAILGLAPPGQPLEDAALQAERAFNASGAANASGTVDAAAEQWRQDTAEFASELMAETTLLEAWEVDTFSICLEPNLGAQGHIIWRDSLPEMDVPSAFSRLPVVGHESWAVQMSSARLGVTQVGCEGGCAVVFDTASPLIAVPQAVFDRVHASLESLHVDCTDVHNLPTFTFVFGDVELSLSPDTYMGEVFGEVSEALSHFWPNPAVGLRTCRPLLMVFDAPTEWGPLWVLGMPFFRAHYTTFYLGEGPPGAPVDRAIFFAPQTGEECERPEVDAQSLAAQPVHTFNVAHLYPPRWAKAAGGMHKKL